MMRYLIPAAIIIALSIQFPFLFEYISNIKSSHKSQPTAKTDRASKVSQRSSGSGRKVVLTASHNGHYFTEARIHKRSVNVLVDTGASMVVLTAEDAKRVNLYPSPSDYTIRVNTANGVTHVASALLRDINIGHVRVHNVQAFIAKPGDLNITLLGMSFLNQLKSISINNNKLTLTN